MILNEFATNRADYAPNVINSMGVYVDRLAPLLAAELLKTFGAPFNVNLHNAVASEPDYFGYLFRTFDIQSNPTLRQMMGWRVPATARTTSATVYNHMLAVCNVAGSANAQATNLDITEMTKIIKYMLRNIGSVNLARNLMRSPASLPEQASPLFAPTSLPGMVMDKTFRSRDLFLRSMALLEYMWWLERNLNIQATQSWNSTLISHFCYDYTATVLYNIVYNPLTMPSSAYGQNSADVFGRIFEAINTRGMNNSYQVTFRTLAARLVAFENIVEEFVAGRIQPNTAGMSFQTIDFDILREALRWMDRVFEQPHDFFRDTIRDYIETNESELTNTGADVQQLLEIDIPLVSAFFGAGTLIGIDTAHRVVAWVMGYIYDPVSFPLDDKYANYVRSANGYLLVKDDQMLRRVMAHPSITNAMRQFNVNEADFYYCNLYDYDEPAEITPVRDRAKAGYVQTPNFFAGVANTLSPFGNSGLGQMQNVINNLAVTGLQQNDVRRTIYDMIDLNMQNTLI